MDKINYFLQILLIKFLNELKFLNNIHYFEII